MIGGTPSAIVAAKNYTITAENAEGTDTATVNIRVNPCAPFPCFYFTLGSPGADGSNAVSMDGTTTLTASWNSTRDALTLRCEVTRSPAIFIYWTLNSFDSILNHANAWGKSLAESYARITSPDAISGPSPTQMTINSVGNADDGAVVTCSLLNISGTDDDVIGTVYAPPP